MKKILLLATLFLLGNAHQLHAQIITTFAGGGTSGLGDGGPAIDAQMSQPIGVAIDAAGNVYLSDRGNNRIRKVNTAGIITTIAGTGTSGYSGDGGPATAAEIDYPYGVAADNAGNIYFADDNNYCIRKINVSGIISTIAGNDTFGFRGDGGPATAAELDGIGGVAVDAIGNVYFADEANNRIRKVNTSGIITTIAGNGTAGHSGDNGLAVAAELNGPYAILLDETGNLYIGEEFGSCVRKINTSGTITTIAGTAIGGFSGDNGPATSAQLADVLGLALDVANNLYISDYYNYRIRKVNATGIITTYAGNGNPDYNGDNIPVSTAQLSPVGLALDGTGNLFIGDFDRIRRITSVEGEKVKEFVVNTNRLLNVKLDERSGLYFVTVTTSQGTYNTKLEVQ